MPDPFEQVLNDDLALIRAERAERDCEILGSPSRTDASLRDPPLVSFCSNDYLGLASDPRVVLAATQTMARVGVGASASRVVCGHFIEHHELETQLAAFLHAPATLLFPTGYQANLGVITALAGPDDLIASDALNHASIIDGCRLTRAKVVRYHHAQADSAASALATAGNFRRKFLVTESLFSMDGDLAPLRELAELTARHRAFLVVDEAHALGVLGANGRGACQAAGIKPDVLVGTLGKAFASTGGFASGSVALKRLLTSRARSFLFTTALPPALAAAATTALQIAQSAEGDTRRAALRAAISTLHVRLGRSPAPAGLETPIVPFIVGQNEAALSASSALRSLGFLVRAIRPPTVPAGTARLRITVSAAHALSDVHRLADAVLALLGLRNAEYVTG